MSHAANLRARQAGASALNKRSKHCAANANGIDGLANGFQSKKLNARLTRDAKNAKRGGHEDGGASIVALQEDTEMAEADGTDEGEQVDEDEEQSEDESEASDADARAGQDEEPSFGDIMRQRDETTTVELPRESVFQADPTQSNSRVMTAPPANSLTTVLTQALRTNDLDLLESCLHVQNLDSIRATIERLNPQHASILLQRLAERMHRRPGRAGSLMVWMQWTIVAFGGYLATQPAAMRQLQTLYTVVRQRASGLQPLLALKGKLDMLEAQMQLRRNISNHHPDDTEDGPVIYVEGEEDVAGRKIGAQAVLGELDDSEDDEDMGLTNGIIDSEDESEDDDGEEGLLDDEAEVTDDDEGDDEDVDFDDNDEDDVSEDDDEPQQDTRTTKRPKSRR